MWLLERCYMMQYRGEACIAGLSQTVHLVGGVFEELYLVLLFLLLGALAYLLVKYQGFLQPVAFFATLHLKYPACPASLRWPIGL